jgi:hypothetical protein
VVFFMPAVSKGDTPTGFVLSASMGAIAGAASKTVVAPVERIRLLMQMANAQSLGAGSGLRDVLQKEGPLGLWRGNEIAVVRATLQKGILFSVQDSLRVILNSDTIAGGIAGLTASGLTYPLDVLRTRHAGRVDAGPLLAVAREAIAAGGVFALWRGASATLGGGVLYEGMRFGAYNQLREQRNERGEARFGPATSGALASLAGGNIIYPNDTVRRRLQTVSGGGETYLQAVAALYREGGVRRLYRGFLLYNLKVLPSAAVQFATYAHLKGLATERSQRKAHAAGTVM